jgi:hypothetical protein
MTHSKSLQILQDYVKRSLASIVTIVGAIGAVVSIYGYISKINQWNNIFLAEFLNKHYLIIWLISISLILFALFYWILIINKRFIDGFTDNFKKRLNSKWDFVGPWRIADDNTLIVTGSDEGGITKNGADWENYTFTFRARVISSCIGVIVRAQDLNNYYMFQIGQESIVPYRRISYPRLRSHQSDETMTIIEYQIGWQVFEQYKVKSPNVINDWFNGRVVVKGQSVSLYINELLILQQDSLLMIPKGKAGFRCSGNEQAFIENVQVRLNI